jgi:hypothetical protein
VSRAVVLSRGLAGLDAPLVTVEVHLVGGLPAFNLVGLPDTGAKEARDRVRAALQNAQFEFPARKITVQWLHNRFETNGAIAGDQPEDREGARSDAPAVATARRGRSDSVIALLRIWVAVHAGGCRLR